MKIAVVGSGISGLTAAYLLSEDHEITVFEANDYIGGHTNTVEVPSGGKSYAVDTGFIVFNEKTYPNFVTLMNRLGVSWRNSDMSFSVQCARTGLEFKPSSLDTFFVQRKNLLRPSFYRMLLDALRFKKECEAVLEDGDDAQTLADFLVENRYSKGFVDYFIIPMGAAIWSADPVRFADFPVRYFAAFFKNHGFLNIKDQPQWLTIRGGSKQYIEPLTRRFADRIRLNNPVTEIRRADDGVGVTVAGAGTESFDQVVIAAHSDQALAMLADPTPQEREILGAIAYQENDTVLHTDACMLPTRRKAWAAWNYFIPAEKTGRVAVTYDMNILQGLGAEDEFCTTLNRTESVDPEKIIRRITYHHPVYTPTSLAARRRREEISGKNRTWYCGAYWHYGFHEDGVRSAAEVCRHFGKSIENA
ncbi:MAG: FAD-dependent oxidoreductase [Desulfobacterales bacterium]|jgi:predicted NAD/FAD-binding protein